MSKRSELEDAAIDAVQRTGLNNLSFRTLADTVGVKSSSVHYYFPEKADLAAQVIEKYTADFEQALQRIDERGLGGIKKLDAFTQIFEDVIKSGKYCLCGMLAAEVASLSEDNRAKLNRFFQLAEHWLKQLFTDHQSAVTSSLSPLVLARVVMSGLEGAILLDRTDGGTARLRAQRELLRGLFAND